MSDILTPLLIDFLEWLDRAPRSYGDVMEAWRTSCPRLTVWEDAVERGFVIRRSAPAGRSTVEILAPGKAFLIAGRRDRASAGNSISAA